MIAAINLILNESEKEKLKRCVMNEEQKTEVCKELEKYIGADSAIDGSELSKDWFPQIKSDIFISHSHEDENLALSIKSEIERQTDYKCFVDSSVWENSAELLRKIDNKYCKSGDSTYNYKKRNYSTSHIYLMLNVALQKMIFKSKFVVFLNTPKSVSAEGTIKNETYSPWIYSEISTVGMILAMQKELRKSNITESRENFSNSLRIKYSTDFSDFLEADSMQELFGIINKKNNETENYFPY